MGGRYIKNVETNVIHDREKADERCNVDDIPQPRRTSFELKELLEPPYTFCKWCMSRRVARAAKRQSRAKPRVEPHKEGAPNEPTSITNEDAPEASIGD